MYPPKQAAKPFQKRGRARLGLEMLAMASLLLACGFIAVRTSRSAAGIIPPAVHRPPQVKVTETPESNSGPGASAAASRIRIMYGETRDFAVAGGVDSVVVVSPETASVLIKNRYTLSITGSSRGETILIVSLGSHRQNFVLEVTGRPPAPERARGDDADRAGSPDPSITGSFETAFTGAGGGAASSVRSSLNVRQKIAGQTVLRISGDSFKTVGKGDTNRAIAASGFGFNRLSVGFDSPSGSVDLLDSPVNTSPLSLNNYTVRGVHISRAAKTNRNGGLQKKGLEVFAGIARPRFSFFEGGGMAAGILLPLASGESWQIRGGAITISPDKKVYGGGGGGAAAILTGSVASGNLSADGEFQLARGEISARARASLKFSNWRAEAEITRLARNSPFNSIGAQSGGRQSESVSAFWRPSNGLSAATGYNHTVFRRFNTSGLADLSRSSFYISAGWRLNKQFGFTLRMQDQRIETTVPGSVSKFQVAVRTIGIGQTTRLSRIWSNSLDLRLNFSGGTGPRLETGFTVNEQLRFTSRKNTVTGFFNYNKKSPSFAGLLIRNPSLLPLQLQPIFLIDPALFLRTYRDRLNLLFPGLELPQTSNLDAGLRFQTAVSRFTLSGEARYSSSEFISNRQSNLYASLAADARLDAANHIQITGWRTTGPNSQSAFTLSYTHIFGVPGKAFNFGDLFGFNRGTVEGRVYNDLNGNGRDDGEPGLSGIKIQIDRGQTALTDFDGRYRISAPEGPASVSLVSDKLGILLRASTSARREIRLSHGRMETASFGLTDAGFIAGRVFNDLSLAGSGGNGDLPGLRNVKIALQSSDGALTERTTDGSGGYNFSALRPGKYTLAIDPQSLPADFRVPAELIREITVAPLQGIYLDIPVEAQRAIAGIAFIDVDGNGRYDPDRDTIVAGASVVAGLLTAESDGSGAYMLRNLPAGRISAFARLPDGTESAPVEVDLPPEAGVRRGVNIIFRK
jgi:SdrD B-like domain/Pilus formation protein N terminal region